jgi:hypothetical protein
VSRFDDPINEAEAALPDICMCVAVDLDFPAGHVRVTDAIGTIQIGGNDYTGSGQIIFDKIEEGTDVVARAVKLTLSGADSTLIAAMRAGGYQGRSVDIYVAFQDRETLALKAPPELLRSMVMDAGDIVFGESEASIELNCESTLRGVRRTSLLNTDADQQRNYPGDRFFDRVGKIAGYVGKWGSQTRIAPGFPDRWKDPTR